MRTIYWAPGDRRLGAAQGRRRGRRRRSRRRSCKYRNEAAQGKHAHGYVHQTLADLGLLGLAISLVALVAWFLAAAAGRSGCGRGVREAAWSPERSGSTALALVAVVFGIHSALDWTWFVPGGRRDGPFLRGLGRRAAGPSPPPRRRAPRTAPPALPLARVRPRCRTGAPGAAARCRRRPSCVIAFGVLASVAVSEPWRSERKGNDALSLAEQGDFQAAIAATRQRRGSRPALGRSLLRAGRGRGRGAATSRRRGARSSRRCRFSRPAPRPGGGSASTT